MLPQLPKRPARERVTFAPLHPEIPREQRHDFHITDDALGHGTPSEKYAANAAAIRTLKQIEAEERLATPEEQEALSRYVGWGGLADCFEETSPHYQELKSLLTRTSTRRQGPAPSPPFIPRPLSSGESTRLSPRWASSRAIS